MTVRPIASSLALVLALAPSLPAPAAATAPTAAPAEHGARVAGVEPAPEPFAASPEMLEVGRRFGSRPGAKDRANAIVRWIFDDADGLRFQYRRTPTLSAREAFEEGAGNCLSLVNLFIALARAAHLDAFPMDVEDVVLFSRQGDTVVRSSHVVAAIDVGGALWTVDFLPGRDKSYRRLVRISDERHAALYHNAVALEAMFDGRPADAERGFRAALAADPGLAETWSNYSVFARRQGDLATAEQRLQQALRRDQHFLPALNNLSGLYRLLGQPAKAERVAERALQAKRQNPFFLVSEAMVALGAGDHDAAEQLLQRAQRIDRGLPETLLALGRLDLARGRPEQAERHFEMARRASRELTPQFQQGVDRKIDKLLLLASH